MPRQGDISVAYNFNQGLNTEATGLNFPPDACVETYDCVFKPTGSVSRRERIDFEENYTTNSVDRTNLAISTYLWKTTSTGGDTSFIVVQIGNTLYFYNTTSSSLSAGLSNSQINLTPFYSGSSKQEIQECTYATGLGYLFVFHPGMNTIYISYSSVSNTMTASSAILQIRDIVGLDDGLSVTERPTSQTTAHKYNNYNQGWAATTAKTQTCTFTNGSANIRWVNHGLAVGDILYFTTTGTLPTNFSASTAYYVVSVVNLDTITVSASASGTAITAGSSGSGAHTGHTFNPYDIWITKRSDFPSNADVWWTFKNQNDLFDLNYTSSYSRGTTHAPKGYYILGLFSQDRSTVSGLAGIATTTYDDRPSVGEFFAGRLWYSGINNSVLINKLYYSQTVESISQIGSCYQKYDPTSQDLSVLLATDGGEITILEMGPVRYLKTMGNFLVIFASNGIWAVTGSQGIGFSPTDYTITKVSDIGSLSNSSFVDIKTGIVWWNADGIYAIRLGQNGFDIKNLTENRIKTFYQQIPINSKKQARGTYNSSSGIVTWLYRTTANTDITSLYEYDAMLNLDVNTSAMYPWTLPQAVPKIHAIIAADVTGQSTTTAFTVVDSSSDTVIDSSGNTVVAFNYSAFSFTFPKVKYLTSYSTGSTYNFTWSENIEYDRLSSGNYKDWFKYDGVGVNYLSYFVSGYTLRGNGQRNTQATYLYMFSDTEDNLPIYDVSARWNYAIRASSGQWPNTQRIAFTDTNYKFQRRKLKIRGNGLTVQFKCASVEGEPMNITGWSTFETANTGI